MVINHFLKNFNVSAKKLSIANDLTQWLAYYKIVGSLPSRSVLSRDPKTTNNPVKVYCDCSIDKTITPIWMDKRRPHQRGKTRAGIGRQENI